MTLLLTAWGSRTGLAADETVFRGCCDGSAAAVISDALVAVASDEENVLRMYPRRGGGPAVAVLRVGVGGAAASGKQEMDLEGAARLGDHVFWIGSHSRNSDGKPRPARESFVATRIVGSGSAARLEISGRPFDGMIGALAREPGLSRFQLGRAATRAGEARGGLNIEAIAARGGGGLWIGFRNPVPEGKALLVSVVNPFEVIEGKAPRFGTPVTLNLGGLGVRDALRVEDRVLLLAGPAEGGGRHRLYVWAEGTETATAVTGVIPKDFQAEALVESPEGSPGSVGLMSDDGGEKIAGVRCEEWADPARRFFRSRMVSYGRSTP